jgi:hypothetical protein
MAFVPGRSHDLFLSYARADAQVSEFDGIPSALKLTTLPLPSLDLVKAGRPAALARSREFQIRGVEFGSDPGSVVETIAQAQQWNTPVILMLTPNALRNSELLGQFATMKPDGVATAVVVDRIPGAAK